MRRSTSRFLLGALAILIGCGGEPMSPGADAGLDAPARCATAADCDDGRFCNGAEECDPAGSGDGCVAGEPPCAAELCDEESDSCDDTCAEPDADGDGHDSVACGGNDCDDDDAQRYPGNIEICDAEGRDEDCRPETYGFVDLDSDGFVDAACCNGEGDARVCGDDCNDMRAISHPGSTEACDALDNDCDGAIDEHVLRTFHPDADGDGFGDASATGTTGCTPPADHVENMDDCDDANAHAHSTTTPEVCDGFDNDCDGTVDEETSVVAWYRDADMDLFGDADDPAPVMSCLPVAGRVTTAGDCDDSLPSVHPTAAETCNEIDDDCDTTIDEGVTRTFYRDADSDTYGTPATTRQACAAPTGYVDRAGDCDDTRAAVYVGAPELCNRRDDNCSSGGGEDPSEDVDGDAHSPDDAACAGNFPTDDCNDDHASVHPGSAAWYDEPIGCGPGSQVGQRYAWCATRTCCILSSRTCSGTVACDSISRPVWDYNCSGVDERRPWVTGSCAPSAIFGRCTGEGPIGSGAPPACGAPVSYRTCTFSLPNTCTAAMTTQPMPCH